MCARRERERDERIVAMEGGEERDDLNAWLTQSLSRFCCVSALPPALSFQGHRCYCSKDCTDCKMNTQIERLQGIVLRPKERMCASDRGKGKKKKIVVLEGGEAER